MDGEHRRKNVSNNLICCLYIKTKNLLLTFQIFDRIHNADPDLWIHPNDSAVVTLNAGEIVVSDSFSAGITLRFPRITKVRYDADSKDPSNIESEESLREKYWEVQKGRSNASVESNITISLGSPDRNRIGAPCRFLTEQQYQESLRHRKSTSRRTKQQKFVAVPKAEVISTILNGISFSVLGGTGYSLVEGTIEYDEAIEQGWMANAKEFYDDKSVIQFLIKHGGKYKISVDHDCTFVLGGNRNDSKVVTYIRAIEHARLQSATFSHKATSKKGKELANIARSEGVLRWTFVVSLVYRWLQTNHNTTESILTTDPDFMKPSVLDFLVRPKPVAQGDEATPQIDPSLYQTNLSSISKMRRALEIVPTVHSNVDCNNQQECSMSSSSSSSSKHWRDLCMEQLSESDRWIAASPVTCLWPYRGKGMTSSSSSSNRPEPSIMVVYPDIFHGIDAASSSHLLTNDWIASALPLLRVMGAFISKELTNDVTHILCDLSDPKDEVVYQNHHQQHSTKNEQTLVSVFVDQNQGLTLLERLQNHDRWDSSSSGNKDVTFISPRWVRKRKWSHH